MPPLPPIPRSFPARRVAEADPSSDPALCGTCGANSLGSCHRNFPTRHPYLPPLTPAPIPPPISPTLPQAKLMRMAAQRWMRQSITLSFNTWAGYWDDTRRAKQKLRRSLAKMRYRQLVLCFDGWLEAKEVCHTHHPLLTPYISFSHRPPPSTPFSYRPPPSHTCIPFSHLQSPSHRSASLSARRCWWRGTFTIFLSRGTPPFPCLGAHRLPQDGAAERPSTTRGGPSSTSSTCARWRR